jgi:hypothetical protein
VPASKSSPICNAAEACDYLFPTCIMVLVGSAFKMGGNPCFLSRPSTELQCVKVAYHGTARLSS